MSKFTLILLAPVLLAPLCAAQEVTLEDALAVADLRYRIELEGGRVPLDEEQRAERRARLAERRVRFVDGAGELHPELPADGTAWLFVVTYEPSGWALVSGRDALAPLLGFDLEAELRWGERGEDFLRHHVDTCLANARLHARSPRNPLWDELLERARGAPTPGAEGPSDGPGSSGGSGSGAGSGAGGGTVYKLHDTAHWGQGGFYNDTVAAMNGGNEGVPTGCTATAMAITMKHFEWPPAGFGEHSYEDDESSVQYEHMVEFGAQEYDWPAMPDTALTSANSDVADLMYHCGVAVDMNYGEGLSTASPSSAAFNEYFRYSGTVTLTSGHSDPIRKSVLAGQVVVCTSWTHVVVADGYRDDVAPFFHLNVGWVNTHGWYDIDAGIPGGDSSVVWSCPYGAPENWSYVDPNGWTSTQSGTLTKPFDSIAKGQDLVEPGGKLFIMEGAYTESVLLDRPMVVLPYTTANSTPGSVVITGAP